jgi:hypothetical protein
LQGKVIALAAVDCSHEFAAHAIRVLAADVIALEQDLVTAADTHQAMAEIAEASIASGAKKGEDDGAENYRLKNSSEMH